jgi:hypothetical protein
LDPLIKSQLLYQLSYAPFAKYFNTLDVALFCPSLGIASPLADPRSSVKGR